jgi:hypothetical protein
MEDKYFRLIVLGVALIPFLFSGSCAENPVIWGDEIMLLSEKHGTLPQGNNGIAARYPGDEGIEKDPAVVFHDDFESGDLSKWVPGWRFDRARITQDIAHTGTRAMQWAVTLSKGDDGGNLGAKLAPGLDVCFFRVYCRLPENFDVWRMHGWSITATAPGVSALGGAGRKPTGKDKFTLTLDTPHNNLSLYTYYPEMPGRWGTSYQTSFSMQKGKWHSIELMLKANEPGKRNGAIAVWVDGILLGHWTGFRYRDVPELKINMVHLVFYLHQRNPPGFYTLFHDDIVVATSYIGPMVPKK